MDFENVKIHLYEKDHDFINSFHISAYNAPPLSAIYLNTNYHDESELNSVNLIPSSWYKQTVNCGEWLTEFTFNALYARDFYLATVLDNLSDIYENRFNFGDSIVYDKYSNILSRIYSNKLSFNNGLISDYIDGTYYVNLNLFDNENNKLKLNNENILYYPHTNSSLYEYSESFGHNIHNGPLSNETQITSFPENANIIYVSNSHKKTINKLIYGNFEDPTTWTISSWKMADASGNLFERIDKKITESDYSKWNEYDFDITQKKFINNYTLGSAFEYASEPTAYMLIDENIDFDVYDTSLTTSATDGTITGGLNYISGNVNMIKDNVLYIW